MSKEIERLGIPVVLITALTPIASWLGCHRIVRGAAVMHPVGDPSQSLERERAFRRKLIDTALTALQTPVAAPTVFEAT